MKPERRNRAFNNETDERGPVGKTAGEIEGAANIAEQVQRYLRSGLQG